MVKFRQICEQLQGRPSKQDIVQLGKLMQQSHHSLRELYECSHPDLERLVALSVKQGVSARVTGAGWVANRTPGSLSFNHTFFFQLGWLHCGHVRVREGCCGLCECAEAWVLRPVACTSAGALSTQRLQRSGLCHISQQRRRAVCAVIEPPILCNMYISIVKPFSRPKRRTLFTCGSYINSL